MNRASLFDLRTNVSSVLDAPLRIGAYAAFAATVVLTPFRFRWLLVSRPLETVYGDFTNFLVFASDVTLVAMLALWALSLMVSPRQIKFGPSFLSIPILGILLTSLASTFFSVDPALSMYHFVRMVLLAGLYVFVINEIESLSQVILPVSLQILIQSLIGVAQYLGQRSLGLISLGELDLDPAWSGVSVVWAEGVRALRAYGLSDHPNILGGCLAFGLLILVGWYVKADAKWQPIAAGIFALGAVALFLTYSRAAWLALLVGMGLFAEGLRRTGNRKLLYKWLGLLGVGAIILLPFIWQNARFLGVRLDVGDSFTQITLEQRSLAERRELNAAANEIFVSNALTGVGVGAFPTALSAEKPDVPYNYQPPHFALLEVAAENGIFGALFYFLAMVTPWLAVWLNRARIELTPTFIGISAVLAAITMVGFFDYYTWLLAPGRIWQWLIWGLWASAYLSLINKGKHA
jgi:O-antigen ligase